MRGHVDSDGQAKTYSMWLPLLLMVLIAGVGLYLVVTRGASNDTPTVQLDPVPATTDPGATSTSSTVPPTFPDGTPTPDSISAVIGEPGETTYLFRLPDGLTDAPTDAVVPPAEVAVSDDGSAVSVVMGCAVTRDAVPAAVTITEDPRVVRVRPVVIGRSSGPPCPADTTLDTVEIVLDEPLGSRRLVTAQAGQPVELAGID